jgi:peptidyl-dipeptidase A
MKKLLLLLALSLTFSCNYKDKKIKLLIKEHEKKVIDLSRENNITYFKATTTGKKKYYKKYQDLSLKLNKIYSDKKFFKRLKKFKNARIKDPILKRQFHVIYKAYESNQIPEDLLEKIVKLETNLEETFATYRATLNGKKVTDNRIDEILKTSTDNTLLKKTWLASKIIAKKIEKKVLKLVKLRNTAAKKLAYKNYHTMRLSFSEQDPNKIEDLFNELDDLTRPTFIKLKNEMDTILAKKYKIKKEDLMPWHYQNKFFQEAPKIYKVNFDKYYKGQDIALLTKKYYESIGLDISDMMEKSDLYEKKGKYQHAYCMNVDRKKDVRVLCNLKDNHKWMDTNLHEFGHAVYDKYIDQNLPWSLRSPAHTFTTEAIAMMFGRFASNPVWIDKMIGIKKNELNKIKKISFKALKLNQLVFSRWTQVVYRFEKAMYENPDQDLNKLWWNLVEKYQMIRKPSGRNMPDYASKIHIALYPAYYHNYMLGDLLASQIYTYITKNITKKDSNFDTFIANKKVGTYLINKIFMPGDKFHWNKMIKIATGEKLTPVHYANQFIEE